jgi:manganese transport protein
MKIWDIFLGIMSAIGGNVDMGQLVFTISGGARFDMRLLWVVIAATVGIVVFAEMSGRVAVVVRRPAFELMRERLGPRMGLVVLVASTAVNILTCTAQVGGIAAILQYLLGGNYHAMMVLGAALLLAAVGFLKFDWLDRTFGFLGLALLVYIAVAVSLQPDWGKVARGLVPALPGPDMPGMAMYAYYVVGLFSAILMPYEIHFYSSGPSRRNGASRTSLRTSPTPSWDSRWEACSPWASSSPVRRPSSARASSRTSSAPRRSRPRWRSG